MVTLWYTKVKLKYSELNEVPDRYYAEVFARLVAEGIYRSNGTRI